MKKTLTALAAIAALTAGVSIALAQAPSTDVKPSPGAQNKGSFSTQQSGEMNKSSAQGQKISGRGKFCMQQTDGSLNCKFASLASCQKAAKSGSAQCSPNPNAGTTGSK